MHRTLTLTLPAETTGWLLSELAGNPHIVSLSVHHGASVKPAGDVVVVQTLNRGADDVMRAVAEAGRRGPISVATAELASLSDAGHQDEIDNDVDEALWEELETGLRHQGRITANFLALMALGGLIGGAGLLATDEPHLQVMAAVAAAVVAPGFEPIAKIPLGIVLLRGKTVWRGLVSMIVGYGTLIVAAAASYLALSFLGSAPSPDMLAQSDSVKAIVDPTWPDVMISAAGAVAGVVIQAAFRRSVIAGALIAMRLIDAAALVGIAAVLGAADLAWQGTERLLLDVGFILVAGLVVFALKQAFVHRRAALH